MTFSRSKAFAISKAKGAVTFAKKSGSKKITVGKRGKVTVRKGVKPGLYRAKVVVRAAGTSAFKPASRVVVLKIRVR